MPSTYSINIGLPTQANRLATISDVLNEIPDNVSKLINADKLRNAFYSTWENSIFKKIYGSASIYYIGIDRDDIYNKIFFGKKQLSNIDVMTTSLLSSTQSDIYFFNNKSDSDLSNQYTKLSILSGTNSNWYSSAPYIKSKIASGLTSSQIQMEVTNPSSGDVYISSTVGKVYINNLGFPTILTNSLASADMFFKYNSGNLDWTFNYYTASSVGTSSATSSIYGSPLTINGYELELTDDRPILQTSFNSIQTGQIFNNMSLSEVIRRMLYKYIAPSCSLSVSPSVGEKGNSPVINLTWSVTKESDSILNCQFASGNVIGFTSPTPINTPGETIVTSTAIGMPPPSFTSTYLFKVSDSGLSNNNISTTVSASASFNLVYPYFYGISSLSASNASRMNSLLSSLTKLISVKSDNDILLSGTGYIYYVYPSSYGLLSSIKDENSATVSSYTYSVYSLPGLTSPNYYWSNISYIVYKIESTTVGIPNTVSWQFNY